MKIILVQVEKNMKLYCVIEYASFLTHKSADILMFNQLLAFALENLMKKDKALMCCEICIFSNW